MGNRISIQFKQGTTYSPFLFSHWGGKEFLQFVKDYVKQLKKDVKDKMIEPLDRFEPGTVLMDFISHLIQANHLTEVKSGYYLTLTEEEGDNSDNGHFIINLPIKKGF